MNTKALSNCYYTLTPNERLPLIHAASARGDEVEVDRLIRSAPRVAYSLSNHIGLVDAFETASYLHLIDLLATAADYLQAYRIADTDDVDLAHEMLECSLFLGHQFTIKLAGWRLFCNEHGFDPDNCWKGLPPSCPECGEVPEQIVELVEVVVETRDDVERVKARQAAEAVPVHRQGSWR
jgi:hypothetical protein